MINRLLRGGYRMHFTLSAYHDIRTGKCTREPLILTSNNQIGLEDEDQLIITTTTVFVLKGSEMRLA